MCVVSCSLDDVKCNINFYVPLKVRNLDFVEFVEEDGVVRTQALGSWGLDRINQRDLPLDDSFSPSGRIFSSVGTQTHHDGC